jgi:hypothetical protein
MGNEIILAGHQPNFLPWLGYFYKIAKCDIFKISDNVQFEKKSYTNRVEIKIPSGTMQLTVPVKKELRTSKKIYEVEISPNKEWKTKQWKTIYLNYKKAKFFHLYAEFFEDFYLNKEFDKLIDFNVYLIKYILVALGIRKTIVFGSKLDVKGQKSNLVLDSCLKAGANVYLAGSGAKKYLDLALFEKNNIKVRFSDYKCPTYPQLWGDFAPNLSIIDLLFNCGPDSMRILLNEK